jgi:alkylation response protein AidB-like acyl-CoA dehydrogenase
VGGGWTVARATLGNESISVGAGTSVTVPERELVEALDAHPDRLPGGSARVGRIIAGAQANELVNLRSIYRAVSGGGPGPEAAITKLAFTESMLDAAHALASAAGPELAYLDDASANSSTTILGVRVWAIGGGTSEIKRNQIGERILGLPRDPLLS